VFFDGWFVSGFPLLTTSNSQKLRARASHPLRNAAHFFGNLSEADNEDEPGDNSQREAANELQARSGMAAREGSPSDRSLNRACETEGETECSCRRQDQQRT
jgi:hypothetical protein